MEELQATHGSHLDSVVDSAFYFSAGSQIPHAVEPPSAALPEWPELPGESAVGAAARRAALVLNEQIIQDVCQASLNSVHSGAFQQVQSALNASQSRPEVPTVILHTGTRGSTFEVCREPHKHHLKHSFRRSKSE